MRVEIKLRTVGFRYSSRTDSPYVGIQTTVMKRALKSSSLSFFRVTW